MTDKDAENFEGRAQKIMDYLKEEEEMNLFYTIQCARVNNKKEIFKERIKMKLNILEWRNGEMKKGKSLGENKERKKNRINMLNKEIAVKLAEEYAHKVRAVKGIKKNIKI